MLYACFMMYLQLHATLYTVKHDHTPTHRANDETLELYGALGLIR